MDQFWEDYYSLLDPQGVAQQLEEEREAEKDIKELEVIWVGNLFVFQRSSSLKSFGYCNRDFGADALRPGGRTATLAHCNRDIAADALRPTWRGEPFDLLNLLPCGLACC